MYNPPLASVANETGRAASARDNLAHHAEALRHGNRGKGTLGQPDGFHHGRHRLRGRAGQPVALSGGGLQERRRSILHSLFRSPHHRRHPTDDRGVCHRAALPGRRAPCPGGRYQEVPLGGVVRAARGDRDLHVLRGDHGLCLALLRRILFAGMDQASVLRRSEGGRGGQTHRRRSAGGNDQALPSRPER